MNNLENFFRNKLDDFDTSKNHWDKPDASVRDNVLTSITAVHQPKRHFKKSILLALIAILLLSASGHIWYLHQNNQALSKTIKKQEVELSKCRIKEVNNTKKQTLNQQKVNILLENEVSNSTVFKTKSTLKTSNKDNNVTSKESLFAKNINELKNIIQEQQAIIFKQKEENKQLNDKLQNLSKNRFIEKEDTSVQDELTKPIALETLEIKELESVNSINFPTLIPMKN